MPGLPPPAVPPEVPDEFAAAYRAAYERAMAEQTDGARHLEPVDTSADEVPEGTPPEDAWAHRLPRRDGPVREGEHRDPDQGPDRRPVRRWSDERWFVPLLLALIALLLVIGAFALGRIFAGRVGGDAAGQVSSSSVMGPSLTSATVMSAPKTPVSTRVPASRSAVQTAS